MTADKVRGRVTVIPADDLDRVTVELIGCKGVAVIAVRCGIGVEI